MSHHEHAFSGNLRSLDSVYAFIRQPDLCSVGFFLEATMQSSKNTISTPALSLKQAALVVGFTYLLNPVTFAGWGWRLREPKFLTEGQL